MEPTTDRLSPTARLQLNIRHHPGPTDVSRRLSSEHNIQRQIHRPGIVFSFSNTSINRNPGSLHTPCWRLSNRPNGEEQRQRNNDTYSKQPTPRLHKLADHPADLHSNHRNNRHDRGGAPTCAVDQTQNRPSFNRLSRPIAPATNKLLDKKIRVSRLANLRLQNILHVDRECTVRTSFSAPAPSRMFRILN